MKLADIIKSLNMLHPHVDKKKLGEAFVAFQYLKQTMEDNMSLSELNNKTFDKDNIIENRSSEVIRDVFTQAVLHNIHKVGKR